MFGKELRNLLFILILFDTSFVLRVLVDEFEYYLHTTDGEYDLCTDSDGRTYYCNPFSQILYDQLIQYVWDYIPIMSILIFHFINFTVRKELKLASQPTAFAPDLLINKLSYENRDTVHLTNLEQDSNTFISNEDYIR